MQETSYKQLNMLLISIFSVLKASSKLQGTNLDSFYFSFHLFINNFRALESGFQGVL